MSICQRSSDTVEQWIWSEHRLLVFVFGLFSFSFFDTHNIDFPSEHRYLSY